MGRAICVHLFIASNNAIYCVTTMVRGYTHTGRYEEMLVYTMIQRETNTRGRVHVYTQHGKVCARARACLWSLVRLRVRLEEIRREVEKKREGQAMHTQVGG